MKNLFAAFTAHALLLATLAPPAAAGASFARPAAARHQQPAPAQRPAPAPQQTPTPAPPAAPDEDEVVVITTNIVQLDVVVTDKRGRHVTDLKPEDFEITEDGRRQEITNFSYVSVPTTPAPDAAARPTSEAAAPGAAAPPRRLKPNEVGRTIALVVDDLGLSFESVHHTKRALRKFVDEQMGPNDLVAVVRSRAGTGALQQFTSDRRMLHAAIDRVRWLPRGRGGGGAFAPVQRGAGAGDDALGALEAPSVEALRAAQEAADDFRDEVFAVGTLGAINYVVRGMRELPGRKSIILFSDGFSLQRPTAEFRDRLLGSLRRLIDLATRASVVIYTVDSRGLVDTGPTAADSFGGSARTMGQRISQVMSQRSALLFNTQGGPAILAEETGGLAFRNTNDIVGSTRRALEDQSGYYLIGYRPASETFDRRFHSISAKVKTRRGLTVRTRTGFIGVADEEVRSAQPTSDRRLVSALLSPFSTGEVPVRLSAYFTADAEAAPVVASTLHLEVNSLKFVQGADGWHAADVEVIAVALGDDGHVVDQSIFGQTLRLRDDVYRLAQRAGIVYTFNMPVKKAGAYQLRTAVRDSATARVGSASQFIEVPDLRKDRLALSGVIVNGSPLQSPPPPAAPGGQSPQAADTQRQGGEVEGTSDPEATHAVRRFRQKTYLDFGYLVFNARADRATGQPQLTSQTRLFRDGRAVFTGEPRPVAVTGQADPRRITAGGRLLLGTELAPGEYVLQVVVTDALRKDKHRTAVQWIDFEILK